MGIVATDVGLVPAVLTAPEEKGRAAPAVEIDDTELVERVREGDVAAFDLLVTRHMKRAYSVAYRLLGQREDAGRGLESPARVVPQRRARDA